MSLAFPSHFTPAMQTEIYLLGMACIKTSYLLYNASDFLHVFSTSLTFTNKRFTPEQTWAKAGMQRAECEKISQGRRKSKISGLFDFCLSPELIRRPHSALCQINLPVKTFLFAPPPPSPNWNCQKCTGFSHLSGL